MCIANCPFNKIKILCQGMIGFEKSFQMMHSNIGLNSRETVPLKGCNYTALHDIAGKEGGQVEKGSEIRI